MNECYIEENVTVCDKIFLINSTRLFTFIVESSAELYLKAYIYDRLLVGKLC